MESNQGPSFSRYRDGIQCEVFVSQIAEVTGEQKILDWSFNIHPEPGCRPVGLGNFERYRRIIRDALQKMSEV